MNKFERNQARQISFYKRLVSRELSKKNYLKGNEYVKKLSIILDKFLAGIPQDNNINNIKHTQHGRH